MKIINEMVIPIHRVEVKEKTSLWEVIKISIGAVMGVGTFFLWYCLLWALVG